MRVDSNVSLRPVEQAVRFEMQRQAQVLVDGCGIIQETRHYQEADGSTSKSHPKETAEDYRYFNDPDLPSPCPHPGGMGPQRRGDT